MTTKKYETGLVCMRVQPFHKGHQRLIDIMLSECKKVIIAIGSANESGTDRNPLEYRFRRMLIQNVFIRECVSGHLKIIGANDINDLPRWSTYITSLIPERVEVYYAGTKQDAEAFIKYPPKDYSEINVKIIERKNTKILSASEIRELFYKGIPKWEKFIPIENIEPTRLALSGEHPFPLVKKIVFEKLEALETNT